MGSRLSWGTTGTYGFGEPLPLLENYGWYSLSEGGQSHPVDSLLPNEFGLFDMHGNNWDRTQSPAGRDQTLYPDPAVLAPFRARGIRVWRSGSFVPHDSWVRTTLYADWVAGGVGYNDCGFRVVRSTPSNSSLDRKSLDINSDHRRGLQPGSSLAEIGLRPVRTYRQSP